MSIPRLNYRAALDAGITSCYIPDVIAGRLQSLTLTTDGNLVTP
jgi:hypothetical protein